MQLKLVSTDLWTLLCKSSVLCDGWDKAWNFHAAPILSVPVHLCTAAGLSNEDVWATAWPLIPEQQCNNLQSSVLKSEHNITKKLFAATTRKLPEKRQQWITPSGEYVQYSMVGCYNLSACIPASLTHFWMTLTLDTKLL